MILTDAGWKSLDVMWFTLWFTLCSLTGRRCNQQGRGLSGLVHEKVYLFVPDIAQSRLECIHRPLVQQMSKFHHMSVPYDSDSIIKLLILTKSAPNYRLWYMYKFGLFC